MPSRSAPAGLPPSVPSVWINDAGLLSSRAKAQVIIAQPTDGGADISRRSEAPGEAPIASSMHCIAAEMPAPVASI